MASIQVTATRQGYYRGRIYEPGQMFVLLDEKDPETGAVLQSAEAAFADADKNRAYGWMRKVKSPDKQTIELEEQTAELERKRAALLGKQMEAAGVEAPAAAPRANDTVKI